MSTARPFTAFNFRVTLRITQAENYGLTNPLCEAAFSECDGIEMTMEAKTVREGGNNQWQHHLAGPVSYGTLTLKRGMTSNIDLWRWLEVASGRQGRGKTARGEVVMLDGAQRPTLYVELEDCLPIKFRAPSLSAKDGLVAIEELQLLYSTLKLKPAEQGGVGP